MRKTGRRVISLLLTVIMLISLLPAVYAEPAVQSGSNETVGAPEGKFVVSHTNYTISNGITETHVIYNTQDGNDQVKGYLTTVSPEAKAEFKVSYSNYYSKNSTTESRAEAAKNLKWDMISVTKQAANYETATGRNVLFATNGDYYNMQTGQPLGYVIMEGNIVQTSNGAAQEPYFAVLKDGSYAIREAGVDCSDVKEAVSGPFLIIKNGEITIGTEDTSRAPRNSIGLKEDGTVVMFLADGRQGVSNGMSIRQVAEVLKAEGCVSAIYLDGGGSATVASKHEGSSTLEIQNTPSDGIERVVASSLLLVSTETGSGKFDHASLSPNNEVYIANGSVEFTAVGVDTAGFPVDIPNGAKWALEDTSYGTIDAATGVFKSNGKCGKVTAKLMLNGKSVGTTSVEIQEPDELYFTSKSLNLRFNSTSDLGLTVRYKQRDVKLLGLDLNWTITPEDGLKPSDIGTIKDNKLSTIKAKDPRKATITVSYEKSDKTVLSDIIAVEIGKMPQVIWDFEPDGNGNVGRGVAQYDWGNAAANSEGYMPQTNPLTYFAWNDEADAPGMITRSGPMLFDGKYIEPDPAERDICYYPAASVLAADGYDFFAHHTSVMQNFSAGGAIVNAENGQVRFGDNALRWDYNYENLKDGYRNVNMWLYTTKDVALEGTPTGFGCWVYAPEGTPNYWLWLTIAYYDETGTVQREWIHFKTQEGRSIQYNGIYWDGWMYVEADLSHLAKYVTPEHPLFFPQGQYFLNLTFIPGGSANENGDKIPMGDFAKGSLYFDNFRVVYGDTIDDMESPVFSGVKANGTELAEDGSTVLTSSTITLNAAFSDPESDNASGIETAKTALYVDGIKQTLSTSTATSAECKLMLANGTHSVKFVVSDGFGNVTNLTRYFTVNDKNSPYSSVKLSGENTAVIGKDYSLTLTADKFDKLGKIDVNVAINDLFGEPTVTFCDGYTGNSTYSNGVVTINAAANSPKSGDIAKITFKVPASLSKGSQLNYEVTSATYTNGDTTLSFAQARSAVGVEAMYDLTASVMTAGGKGTITVTKADGGSAAKRVAVYLVKEDGEDELVGKTNSTGELITNRFCRTAGEKFTIYAKDADGNLSFYYSGVTYGRGSDEVTPSNIRLNAVSDPTRTQSMSWFSSPEYTESKAVVQYIDKVSYDSGNRKFSTASGECKTYSFASDNSSSQINSVTVTGLNPGTTYYYRVGDGVNGHWSELSQFTTTVAKENTKFFVLGDTQLSGNAEADAADIETMNKVADKIQATGVKFGVQTGDFVDSASNLTAWNEILDVFGDNYGNLPIVQVMGNHEYYGGSNAGATSEAIFDVPDKNYYSVEYGNVYMAVINCNANLEAAAKWLVSDAAASNCEWKVLTVHQPPYYTNPKGSSAAYNQYLPSAVDAAGIDFVFSGHDHSYARTEPLTGGKVDKENGAVYFITGDLGEKSRSTEYEANNNPDFHFAKINQDYDAIYFIAETVENTMTVNVYNVDGTVVDKYVMHHADTCDRNGHKFVYSNGVLTCSVCGDKAEAAYSGLATDAKTGKTMYFIGGKFQTGWSVLDTDIYHFDKNGLAHKVTVQEDIKTDCTKQGHKTVVCECGETYTLTYGRLLGHDYVEMTREDGSIFYRCSRCGNVSEVGLPFLDVSENSWYAKELSYCYHNGYINGTTRISFSPNDNITREQLAAMIWRIEGEPAPDSSAYPFKDKSSDYSKRAICWATENNIIKGYTDGTFHPKDVCSRQDMVTIFYRYANFKKADTSASVDLTKMFTDASSIGSHAKAAVSWATAEKIINGFNAADGMLYFKPAGTATRAQVAVVIARFMTALGK